MTRLKNVQGVLVPTTQGADESTVFVPEGVFSFTTIFGFMPSDDGPKIVWTLSKDRQKGNLWTPVAGGEDDYPAPDDCKPYSIFDFGQNTGVREAREESGVKIKILGTGPFWICGMPYGYKNYELNIIDKTKKENEQGRQFKIQGVHTVLYYYLGEIIGEPKLCVQAGAEYKYRNVSIKTLTVAESLAAFEKGELNAYPTMKEAFLRAAYLLTHAGHNPYLLPYPEDWAEKEGLMERPWKNNFITLQAT